MGVDLIPRERLYPMRIHGRVGLRCLAPPAAPAPASGKLGAAVGIFLLPVLSEAWGLAPGMIAVAAISVLGFLITAILGEGWRRAAGRWRALVRGPDFQSNLTVMVISPAHGTFAMAPKLDKLGNPADAKMVPFATWWDGETIYAFMSSGLPIKLSRKRLVCVAANQDGGAHVDPQLDQEYQALERGAEWTMHNAPGAGSTQPVPLTNAHLVLQRHLFQIGARVGLFVLESSSNLRIERLGLPRIADPRSEAPL